MLLLRYSYNVTTTCIVYFDTYIHDATQFNCDIFYFFTVVSKSFRMGKLLFVLLLVWFGCEKTSGFKVSVGSHEATARSRKVGLTVRFAYHCLCGITVFGISISDFS